MGLRSGDWLGHSRTSKCFLRSHSLVALAVCLGSLSCWKTQPRPIFNALTEGRRLLAKISRYMAPPILPSIRCSRSVPYAEKHPQSMMFPPPCFTVGMVFLGLSSFFFFLQTRWVEFIPKSYILVSSDHMTLSHASSGSSRWQSSDGPGHVLAWAGRLQDFNPWRCSGLLMVTVETVVPALFRSLTSSRLIPHLSLDHWYSTRRDLAWSPSSREIDSHLEFLPFSNNCAKSCCFLTKLFAYCPVAHPSLVQVYNFGPSVFRQPFGLAHSGEVGVWLIECVNRCLLYR